MASTFPSTLDAWGDTSGDTVIDDSHVNDLRDAIEKVEAKLGCNNAATTTTFNWKCSAFLVGGRKIWIYDDTAPTGWTAVDLGDKVIALKGGASYYNVSGGTTGGVWPTTFLASTHRHVVTIEESTFASWDSWVVAGGYARNTHLHLCTSNVDSSHLHASSGEWRPDAVIGIIIQKDT